jgi:inner membrane protein
VPSSLSHAMVAVTLGSIVAPRRLLRPFLVIGAASAVLPDIDAIGRPFYGAAGDIEALGGHRGFTHSLVFASVMGLVAFAAVLVNARWRGYRVRFGLFVAAVTCLHGVLDLSSSIGAATSPVQFWSPFSTRVYVLSEHPINGPFSELFLCLLPLIAVTRVAWHVRGIPRPRWSSQTAMTLGLQSVSAPTDISLEKSN